MFQASYKGSVASRDHSQSLEVHVTIRSAFLLRTVGTHMANHGEADMEYYLYQFHIVIVGEQGVGKSCILRRFTEAAFTTDAMSTVGVDFSSRMIVIDGHRLKLQLWDTAGLLFTCSMRAT